ncbi:MAG: isoprenylcysteine carboxylmethyltransferase family protein [Verrucomicrobiales bacterium]|nr:isoprenylcysteine carboxylmethyltransferase family protein [Verrucomicrobiales bacterium]
MRSPIFLITIAIVFFIVSLGSGAVAAESSLSAVGPESISPGELMLRRLLVSASGLIYWGGVIVQARRVRKKIGRIPNLKPKGRKERVLWVGWMIVVFGWIVQPVFVNETAFVPALAHRAALISGVALIVLGYLATLWCYAAMGAAWRIGIDIGGTSSLVQAGPYRLIRHPIYSFQMVMLVGAALLLPTLASLMILALHFICASIKSGDEEVHLTKVFGGEYREYMTRSGRFFPRI